MATKFEELVGEGLRKCKEVVLTYLQAKVCGRGVTRPRDATSTTKKETVMLPTFSGDKVTAYLRYPVWRKQWMPHIMDYEEKYRPTMLLHHLDEVATEKIIGLENNYDQAMVALD